MTAENFAYWLQGLLELNPDLKTLDEKQVKMIREHLGYVFSTPVVPNVITNPPSQKLPEFIPPTLPYAPQQSTPPYNPFWTTQRPTIECSTQQGAGTVSDSVMTTYC